MRVLGIDPGIRGGLAIVDVGDDIAPQLVDAIDIPVCGVGAKERVDGVAVRDFVAKYEPQHAFVERGQAMPQQGASSGFKYGRAIGALEAVVACCEIPMSIVEPSMWKRFHGLRGGRLRRGNKEGGRQRALQLFPAGHAMLARRKDHGRAEAALIAIAGAAALFRRADVLTSANLPVSETGGTSSGGTAKRGAAEHGGAESL